MQFERLKKSHRKEILIGGMILVCVISAITITTTRAKYKLTEDIKIASGTINYKPYDFKIMAMYKSEDGTNYTEITTMPESGYIVNESKSYCTTDNKTQVKGKIKTENGKHYITGITKSDKCYIWFDKKTSVDNAQELLAKVQLEAKNAPTTFTGPATTDEGIFATDDGMYGGTSYYWRGAATTNHVIFANKCWRIIRINGDGTLRIIYNGTPSGGTCTGNGANSATVIMGSTNAEKYYATSDGQYNNPSYVGWTYTLNSQRPANNATGTASNAKIQTEAWFNNNSNFTDAQRAQVVEGKFCNERTIDNPPSSWNWTSSMYVTSWSTWSSTNKYFAYSKAKRIYEDGQPTLSCTAGDVYTLKAGAITADEVAFAGSVYALSNSSYYLYNGQKYWTMSSDRWVNGFAWVIVVWNNGTLFDTSVDVTDVGLRPVINLNSNVTFNTGSDGTQNNPYIVQ